jgi:hypothetical protein
MPGLYAKSRGAARARFRRGRGTWELTAGAARFSTPRMAHAARHVPPVDPRPRRGSAAQPWTVAPALGVFVAALAGAIFIADGDLRALRGLPTRRPPLPPASPSAPATPEAVEGAPAEVAPPLPPKPDLAPERAPGGKPLSIAGKTVEDFCVEPARRRRRLPALGPRRLLRGPGRQRGRARAAGHPGVVVRRLGVGHRRASPVAARSPAGRVRRRRPGLRARGRAAPLQPQPRGRAQRVGLVAVVRRVAGQRRRSTSTASATPPPRATGTIKLSAKTPSGKLSSVEVYYLAQPGGGTAELVVDGEVKASLDTAPRRSRPASRPWPWPTAITRSSCGQSGKVRLFGFTLERDAGVVVDNMALVSANAKNMLLNRADHWTRPARASRGRPGVIMIGTNEAQWLSGSDRSMAEYEEIWKQAPDAGARRATPGVVPGRLAARSGRGQGRQAGAAPRSAGHGGDPARRPSSWAAGSGTPSPGWAARARRSSGASAAWSAPTSRTCRARHRDGRRRTGGRAGRGLQGLQGPVTTHATHSGAVRARRRAAARRRTPSRAPVDRRGRAAGRRADAGVDDGPADAAVALPLLDRPGRRARRLPRRARSRRRQGSRRPRAGDGVRRLAHRRRSADRHAAPRAGRTSARAGAGSCCRASRRSVTTTCATSPTARAASGRPSWAASATTSSRSGWPACAATRPTRRPARGSRPAASCPVDKVARFDIFHLRTKASGAFSYQVDDGPWIKVTTKLPAGAPEAQLPAVTSVEVPDGRHKLSLKPPAAAPIELFGVALERTTPGVVVDALGVVGRRLTHLRSWDWSVIGPQVSARAPALVILQYGTNEADDPKLDPGRAGRRLRRGHRRRPRRGAGRVDLDPGAARHGRARRRAACDKLRPPARRRRRRAVRVPVAHPRGAAAGDRRAAPGRGAQPGRVLRHVRRHGRRQPDGHVLPRRSTAGVLGSRPLHAAGLRAVGARAGRRAARRSRPLDPDRSDRAHLRPPP